MKNVKTIEVPRAVRDEILEVARRAGRSAAFVVRRALAAAPDAPLATVADPAPLELVLDEDDDPKTLARVAALVGGRDAGAALAGAWEGSRARFLAWLAKHEEAERAVAGDDLDRALEEARASRDPARLAALAASEWVRVRVRVAENPHAPPSVLALLARDRDPSVRARLETRAA